jgi:hypothetical protein
MEEENLKMAIDLPETDEPKKKKEKVNCLGEVLREILDEIGLKDADVIKGTGLAWSSYHGWVTEGVESQLAGKNLLKLWTFLNQYKKIPLSYLLYGIGEIEELENGEDDGL